MSPLVPRMRDAVTIEDVRRVARRKLPRPIFEVIDGGAGDEVTVHRNRDAFARLELRPRPFEPVADRTLTTTVLGQAVTMPVMLAPTGAGRLFHRTAELGIARAAVDAGTVYMQSSVTAYPMEDVNHAAKGTAWYQLYLPGSETQARETIRRVADAGYRALALTIDMPVLGNRDRDTRNKILNLPMWHPAALAQGFSRPFWGLEFLRGNVGLGAAPRRGRPTSLGETRANIANAYHAVQWSDVERVRSLWDGPLVIKGVMRHEECARLVELGVDAFVVSNHGGRQLDGVAATIDALPAIVEAVGDRAEVYLDGGIRRGTDVVKALALGARGVFVGRPYLYGLAAAGPEGVARVLEILRAELDHAMALAGAPSIAAIDGSLVGRPSPTPLQSAA